MMKTFTNLITLVSLISFTSLQAQHFIQHQNEAQIDHISDAASNMGGGAAFFDADNDGDDDLYITGGLDTDHFYVNNGDGTFTNQALEAGFGLTDSIYTAGVIAGDIDNDGHKDLFVITWFSDSEDFAKNLLFRNNGDGTFTESFNQNGPGDKSQTFGATFIDYDRDGLLDIYAVNYVESPQLLYDDNDNIVGFDHDCFSNLFYHNLGNGEFEEKAFALGLQDNGCALAVTATDFDLDHDMDIYIANDFGEFILPNQLYQYDADNGFFWGVGEAYNVDVAMYGMGIAIGDIDQDLDLDYYVTNFGKNALLRNDGSTFANITDESGTGDEWVIQDSTYTVGWGTAFIDIDNDQDLDLYVANGHVPAPDFLPSSIFSNDALFLNNDGASFTNVSEDYGINNMFVSRGMTYSDYDNDGDIDILSVVLDKPDWAEDKQTILFNNQKGNEKNWLQVTLEGVKVNRDAYGSKIYAYAGDQTWMRELSGGASHCSHYSSRLHFGLDDIEMVDSVQVVWTGGENSQTVYEIEANQLIHIVEDTTMLTNTNQLELKDLLVEVFPNPAKSNLSLEIQNHGATVEEIGLYNAVGVLVRSFPIPQSFDQTMNLSLRGCQAGVYWLKVQIEGKIISKKVAIGK